MPPAVAAPPLALLLAEPARAALELASLPATWPWLADAPRGDGHPVIVLPGLFADDGYTAPLRAFLRTRGFEPHGWRHGVNWGHWDALERVVLPLLERVHARAGRKVSLVGASMGGLYARELARRVPAMVRCVVTMASAAAKPQRANHVWPVFEAATAQDGESLYAVPPPGVPSTSVFSRTDGLSNGSLCLQPEGPCRENIEVLSSHLGMICHPATLYVVADRLAQPQGQWKPFEPPAAARGFYGG